MGSHDNKDKAEVDITALLERFGQLDGIRHQGFGEEIGEFINLLRETNQRQHSFYLSRLFSVFDTKKDRGAEINAIRSIIRSGVVTDLSGLNVTYKQAANSSYAAGYINEAREYLDLLRNLGLPAEGPQINKVRAELLHFTSLLNEMTSDRTVGARKLNANSNILYVMHNCFPFAFGGYAVRSHNLIKCLTGLKKEESIDCVIALARLGFPYDARRGLQVDLPREPFIRNVEEVDYHFFGPSSRIGRIYSYFQDASMQIGSFIEDRQISVVHAASNFHTAFPAFLAARRAGLPFVYEIRSFWGLNRSSRDPKFADTWACRRDDIIETLLYESADRLIVLNEAMKTTLVDREIPEHKIYVAPNCVDCEVFCPGNREPDLAHDLGIAQDDIVIGFVGSFVNYEGLPVLMEAFGRIYKTNKNVKLLLVGDEKPSGGISSSPILDGLVRQAEELECSKAVRFIGRVPYHDVTRYYSLIDIAPFPRLPCSITDLVSPLKPLEALAMGKCVVISAVGGMKDQVIDGKTGIVYGNNVDDLVSKLLLLLSNSSLRQSLGAEGRRWVANERRWERIADVLNPMYKDLIAGGSSETSQDLRLRRKTKKYLEELAAGPRD